MNIDKKFNNAKFEDLKPGDMFSYSYRDVQDIGNYDVTNDIYLVVQEADETKNIRVLDLNTNQLYRWNPSPNLSVTRYWGTLNLYLEPVDNIIEEE